MSFCYDCLIRCGLARGLGYGIVAMFPCCFISQYYTSRPTGILETLTNTIHADIVAATCLATAAVRPQLVYTEIGLHHYDIIE